MLQNLPFTIFTNEIGLLEKKKIHLVCQADNSETATVERYRKEALISMKRDSLLNYIETTNDKIEASTLYPVYYLSLYPKVKLESEEEFRNEFYGFFKDLIILANEKYLRSDTILFVFEKEHQAYSDLILEIINQLLKENIDTIIFTRNIYTYINII